MLKKDSIWARFLAGPASEFSFGTYNIGPTTGSKVLAVSVGFNHTCAILTDHTLKCWGRNDKGQLGYGDTLDRLVPVDRSVNLGTDRLAVEVVAGDGSTCALLDDASLKCWGENQFGQLGTGDYTNLLAPSTTPIDFGADGNIASFSNERGHACAVTILGVVRCWGSNGDGELGIGVDGLHIGTSLSPSPYQVDLGLGRLAKRVEVGHTTCVILDDDTSKCWGPGQFGTLGQGFEELRTPPSASIDYGVDSSGQRLWPSNIAVNGYNACAILNNGQVKCSGWNYSLQLGDGSGRGTFAGYYGRTTMTVALNLGSGRTARDISVGVFHVCVVLDNAQVKCWGSPMGGRGYGNNIAAASPPEPSIDVGTGRTAKAISVGTNTCAILDDWTLKCWGNNPASQIGVVPAYSPVGTLGIGDAPGEMGDNLPRVPVRPLQFVTTSPVSLQTVPNPTDIVMNSNSGFSGLSSNDFALYGSAKGCTLTPPASATESSTFAIRLRCATAGSVGISIPPQKLLDSDGNKYPISEFNLPFFNIQAPNALVTRSDDHVPTSRRFALRIRFSEFATNISASDFSNNAASNPASCTFAPVSSTARPGIDFIVSASCTSDGNLDLVLRAGSMFDSSGTAFPTADQVVLQTLIDSSAPTKPTSIAVGKYFTCALFGDGTVKCWGSNDSGTLGTGSSILSTSAPGDPVDFGSGRIAVAIATKVTHVCANLDDGTVKCWGKNTSGELGNGNNTASTTPSTPVNLGSGRTAVAITTAANHSCAILDDGTVKCWGDNEYGQLGVGNTTDSNTPGSAVDLGAGRTAVAISAGQSHTCALLDDGNVRCWGYNWRGALGNGNTETSLVPAVAVNLGVGLHATAISAGDNHTCAILTNRSIKCWGSNSYGELGNGTTQHLSTPGNSINLGTGRTAIAVSAGGFQTCAILDDGTAKCWGYALSGALGTGPGPGAITSPGSSINLGAGRSSVFINTGFVHTCAILDDATVKCWGTNSYGALGLGNQIFRNSPTYIVNFDRSILTETTTTQPVTANPYVLRFTTTQAIYGLVGSDFTFSGTASGCRATLEYDSYPIGEVPVEVRCDTEGSMVATLAAHSVSAIDGSRTAPIQPLVFASHNISAGPLHVTDTTGRSSTKETIILRFSSDKAFTGLADSDFQYTGTATGCVFAPASSSAAEGISVIVRVRSSTAGTFTPTLVADSLIDVLGSTGPSSPLSFGTLDVEPIGSSSRHAPIDVSVGSYFTCATLDNGQIVCWGSNSSGQLGNNDTTDRTTPEEKVSLPTLTSAAEVDLGGVHSCMIDAEGDVWCWGSNTSGQLGDGSTTRSGVPVSVNLGGRSATALALGLRHSCALLDNGSVRCWGSNQFGQVSSSSDQQFTSPAAAIDLGTGRTAVAVAAGDHFACAILDDGITKCWGANHFMQLGDGTTISRSSPVRVALDPNRTAVALSAGSSHACVVLDDGSVSCWGSNVSGQVGAGNLAISLAPVPVASLGAGRTAIAVSAGQIATCALLDNFEAKCWGGNHGGLLGLGSNVLQSTSPSDRVEVGTGRFVTSVDVSTGNHACALLDNQSIKCWGGNLWGQLGYGDTTNRGRTASSVGDSLPSVPVTRPALHGPTALPATSSSPFTFDLAFDSDVSGLESSDFSYTGTADDCRFSPLASSGGARTTIQVQVRCASGGSFTPILSARSVVDTPGISGPASDSTLGNTTVTVGSTFAVDTTVVEPSSLNFVLRVRFDSNITGLESSDFSNAITGPTAASGCTFTPADSSIAGGLDAIISVSCTNPGYIQPTLAANSVSDAGSTLGPAQPLSFGLHDGRRWATHQVMSLATGGRSACAIFNDLRVKCWGRNNVGQLGYGYDETSNRGGSSTSVGTALGFLARPGSLRYVDIAIADSSNSLAFACGLTDQGSIDCWGRGGDESIPLGFGYTAVAISAGVGHACAIVQSGEVKCWGEGGQGQLGNNTTSSSTTPVTVSLPSGRHAVQVEAFGNSTCAILDDQSLRCWGENSSGQLGRGSTTDQSSPGTAVGLPTGRHAVSVSGGISHACVALDDGTITCWGSNVDGELGRGTTSSSVTSPPAPLALSFAAVEVSAGTGYSCARSVDGLEVVCWGANAVGQLGIGSQAGVSSPPTGSIVVGTGTSVSSIAAATNFVCARLADGSVKCWGGNESGQLALGDTANRGDSPNEMGDDLPFSNLLAPSVTATALLADSTNPLHYTVSFSDDVMGLVNDDFSNLGTATNCGFAPQASIAKAGVPVSVLVDCETSGTVIPRLRADAVFDFNWN
ncbi:MAG: RCC1 domain-containing protein, partial [Ilumatobacteraceae bacterium]